jgi:hypothetical protein
MAEIKSLFGVTANPEPNADVIRLLERFLEEAKRGEIKAVALAMVRPNRDVTTGWTTSDQLLTLLLGAVSGLQARMASEWASRMENE